MKNIFKTMAPFLLSLALITVGFLGFAKIYAAVVTPAFPAALNLFTEGEVIEEEDWNAIEIRIGETGTTTRSTLTFQVNDLMASTTLPQITTLLGLTSTGALNVGSITSGFGAINIGSDALTTTGLLSFGTALGTSATTTNFFSTTASSTNLFSAAANIGALTVTSCTGCAGSAGGSDTQVQFNDSTAFGGDAGFVYNKTTDLATLTNLITTSSTSTSATSTSLFSTTASSTNLFASAFNFGSSILSLVTNTITAGATAIINFGSAVSFKIPTGSSFSATAEGQLYHDNTSDNLTFSTSTDATSNVVFGSATTTLYAFTVASTSPDFINGGVIELPAHHLAQVAIAFICKADAGTSVVVNLSSIAGSSDTNTATCTTTSTQFNITTNAGFAAYAAPRLEIGAITGSVDRLSIRVVGYRTAP